jgi:hypothetical protein
MHKCGVAFIIAVIIECDNLELTKA